VKGWHHRLNTLARRFTATISCSSFSTKSSSSKCRRGCCRKASCVVSDEDSIRTTSARWTHCGTTTTASVERHLASWTPGAACSVHDAGYCVGLTYSDTGLYVSLPHFFLEIRAQIYSKNTNLPYIFGGLGTLSVASRNIVLNF